MKPVVANIFLGIITLCCFNCQHQPFTKIPKYHHLIDTTISVGKNHRLRVIKHEEIAFKADSLKSIKINVCIENLTDSILLLCQSHMFYSQLDSIFYVSYMTDMEYANDFLMISANSKVELVEQLLVGRAVEYLLTYEVIPGFSESRYGKFYTTSKSYTKGKKKYVRIGVIDYPEKVYYLNIDQFKVWKDTMPQ